ncbi:hypothetical protein ANO11243_056670 [Dothideomycetidae sp. 11243]|nr:hypothetical protein ANO11243_056670 [fungal sp. No.11243]
MSRSSDELGDWNRSQIHHFFNVEVPKILASSCTCSLENCIEFASTLLQTNRLEPVDWQGNKSYTLVAHEKGKVIQFRLELLNDHINDLATRIYGPMVPIYHGNPELAGFPLPVWSKSASDDPSRILQDKTLRTLAPEVARIVRVVQASIHKLDRLPLVLTHTDLAELNVFIDDEGHFTGVIDFDEAAIDPFGMSIWCLYECYIGFMDDGRFHFFGNRTTSGKTAAQILETSFWKTLWTNVPENIDKSALYVALAFGVNHRTLGIFLKCRVDANNEFHMTKLEYARSIIPTLPSL